jgi:drug/metabolite transporter (DMT)-like permease
MPDGYLGGGQTLTGAGLGLLASASWALANFAIHRSARDLGTLVPVFWGQLIGLALMAPLGWVWPADLVQLPWGWVLAGGLGAAAGYVFMFRAFAGGPVSVVSPVLAIWSLLSAAMAVLIFDEAMPPVRLVGAALITLGAMGVAARGGDGDAWRASRLDVYLSVLLSAFGFALMVLSLRALGPGLGPVFSVGALWVCQWAVVVPWMLYQEGRRSWPPRGTWLVIAAFGALEALGSMAVVAGTSLAPVSVVAPASSLAPLLTVFVGRVWLGEVMGPDRVAFSLLVALGVGLIGLS